MQILTVDIGTGTQDILLFDSERAVENCLKLVMPSPTLLIGEQIKRATAARLPLLIRGVVMGGGPLLWAVEAHRRAGLRVLATPDAARTFNDDLDYVQRELGVEIIPGRGARKLARGRAITPTSSFATSTTTPSAGRLPRSASTCVPTPWRWRFSITARRRPTSATGSSAWITWSSACAATGG